MIQLTAGEITGIEAVTLSGTCTVQRANIVDGTLGPAGAAIPCALEPSTGQSAPDTVGGGPTNPTQYILRVALTANIQPRDEVTVTANGLVTPVTVVAPLGLTGGALAEFQCEAVP